ncbi:MAG: DNA repair protein RadA [Candidatus Omnitrophica bacterium]|nr:DNA repair protein RadA [Candidatus Omnitrophota bacterium]
MMKSKTIFSCQSCGYESMRWVGKCPGCQSWNSFVEETKAKRPAQDTPRGLLTNTEGPVLLSEVTSGHEKRFQTGIKEFDRVLGGGIVVGSVTLIGGDPGIGKSTIALQAGCRLSEDGHKVLYVSGEESVAQTKMRADRIIKKVNAQLFIVNQIDLNVIIEYINKLEPDVVVIDSIQVVYEPGLESSPGSVSQVRECAALLTQLAKAKNIALFLIGHVTKEGMIAGPRVLEHIVDTVLYFEGERYSAYRVLRTTKNRFGSTNELGVFEMTSSGLIEVENPSEIFLSERSKEVSGSVVVPILEGTRPFLVEVQGLVTRSAFGMVRHKAQGFDANRLALLVAVLEKRLTLRLEDQDIFLNIVGGVRVEDPAADLGVALAVASAFLDKPVPAHTAVLGEVGLSAEVRSVSHIMQRLNEAEKLGFKQCLIPKNNLKTRSELKLKTLKIVPVATVKEALDFIRSS